MKSTAPINYKYKQAAVLVLIPCFSIFWQEISSLKLKRGAFALENYGTQRASAGGWKQLGYPLKISVTQVLPCL